MSWLFSSDICSIVYIVCITFILGFVQRDISAGHYGFYVRIFRLEAARTNGNSDMYYLAILSGKFPVTDAKIQLAERISTNSSPPQRISVSPLRMFWLMVATTSLST